MAKNPLERVFSGETLERIALLKLEPDAEMSVGEMALVGKSLTDLGKFFIDSAKADALPMIEGGVGKDSELIESGVIFKWRKGGSQMRVDTAKVRSEFPPAENADLYKKVDLSPNVAVTFKKE